MCVYIYIYINERERERERERGHQIIIEYTHAFIKAHTHKNAYNLSKHTNM